MERMAKVDPTVMIDSVIMIDHFNGIPAATKYLSEMQGKLAVSVITRAEVLTGLKVKTGNSRGVCWTASQHSPLTGQ